MTQLSLSPRFFLVLFAVCFVLLLMALLFLQYVHLGGMPTFAHSTAAVLDKA